MLAAAGFSGLIYVNGNSGLVPAGYLDGFGSHSSVTGVCQSLKLLCPGLLVLQSTTSAFPWVHFSRFSATQFELGLPGNVWVPCAGCFDTLPAAQLHLLYVCNLCSCDGLRLGTTSYFRLNYKIIAHSFPILRVVSWHCFHLT